MTAGYVVIETIKGAHPKHPNYPLLPGDLLVREKGRVFAKEAPGICVLGFRLTSEQVASLRPVEFAQCGLTYVTDPPDPVGPHG